MVALRAFVLLSATLAATMASRPIPVEDRTPGKRAAAAARGPTTGVRLAASGDPRFEVEPFERGFVARLSHDSRYSDCVELRRRPRGEESGGGGSTNFLPPVRPSAAHCWGLAVHFRTNLNPRRWAKVPCCARRGAPSEQYYFLQDAAMIFKCACKATTCVFTAVLVALASQKFWELTKMLITVIVCNVDRCSGMLNVGFVMLIPTRRHWKVFVLALLLFRTGCAMDPSAQPTPSGTVGLVTAAAAVGAATAASTTAGMKRARDDAAVSVPADGNASKFMSALGTVLRGQRGGMVDATPLKTSDVLKSARIAQSSLQHLLHLDRKESLVKAGLIEKAGYGKVRLTPAGIEWLVGPVSNSVPTPAITMSITVAADRHEGCGSAGGSHAAAPADDAAASSSNTPNTFLGLARAIRGQKVAASAKVRAEHQARGLRASIARAADTTHEAWAMGLKPRSCFDINDETEWLLPSSIDMKDRSCGSDESSSESGSDDDDACDDDVSDSGSKDGVSENGEASSESGADENSALGSDEDSDAVEDDGLSDTVPEDGSCVSWSFFHRRVNNTIARMAVYCGYEKAGEAEPDSGSERDGGARSTPKPKKASVGKLRQLLANIHKRLPKEAIPPPDDKEQKAQREVFANIKSAIAMLKAKTGYNKKGVRLQHNCTEADRHAYHTILTAALGGTKSAFRRICRALKVSTRKGKRKGKVRPSAAAQQSYDRRCFVDRSNEGDFQVGDWVQCRGVGKDRALYTTEVHRPCPLVL